MPNILLASLIAPLALQGAPAAPAETEVSGDGPRITSISQLPIEQAAAPRCGLAFAVVGRWQNMGDPRGAEYESMETGGGREFFVRTLAKLMDDLELSREEISAMVMRDANALAAEGDGEQVAAMMPACLMLKDASGL